MQYQQQNAADVVYFCFNTSQLTAVMSSGGRQFAGCLPKARATFGEDFSGASFWVLHLTSHRDKRPETS